MKYSFISQYKKTWSVNPMCRILGVSRNGYYSFQKRQAALSDDLLHRRMVEKIKEVARATDYTYGSRRMKSGLCF
ncbi:hypothetical protein SAMN05421690_102728 [Nitrosomonas sp. Nm51]|nr:hypothetical protein SAMN05421690_102728 [Nitrosomonas sp. Nm51]